MVFYCKFGYERRNNNENINRLYSHRAYCVCNFRHTNGTTAMKATELRLNNWIKESGNEYQVHSISENKVGFSCENIGVFYHSFKRNDFDFEGVKLTDEWLVKFGFNRRISGKYSKGGFQLQLNTLGVFRYHITPVNNIVYLDYVHQLQNLYFAITGEELNI